MVIVGFGFEILSEVSLIPLERIQLSSTRWSLLLNYPIFAIQSYATKTCTVDVNLFALSQLLDGPNSVRAMHHARKESSLKQTVDRTGNVVEGPNAKVN